jgi:two-component system chemotaxis response regulator CheB
MVVDDAAIVRRLISRMLNKDPDITVVASVANGQMAVDSLARSPVGVVV